MITTPDEMSMRTIRAVTVEVKKKARRDRSTTMALAFRYSKTPR
eukprot:CAMPEP_0185760086 /NCGR_PEP_ID=MMETSP1174-20130828/18940_1 /TAXON_ID=35687 /ORGANISM="Dictyocha speculum, Strain CCMP1381" /LENGTH=43 /DNA_ID= /DNA_START= /DNA_END= /DNA_ORIENTATION=